MNNIQKFFLGVSILIPGVGFSSASSGDIPTMYTTGNPCYEFKGQWQNFSRSCYSQYIKKVEITGTITINNYCAKCDAGECLGLVGVTVQPESLGPGIQARYHRSGFLSSAHLQIVFPESVIAKGGKVTIGLACGKACQNVSCM